MRQALLHDAARSLESLPWGIGSGHREIRYDGVVFLAKAAGQYVLRTVSLKDKTQPISDDLLRSLQWARCAFGAQRDLPDAIKPELIDAWDRARHSITNWFQSQRDPRARHSAIPKVQRDAIDLLQRAQTDEAYAVAEILNDGAWPLDIQKTLRSILKADSAAPTAKVNDIVALVRESGLRTAPNEPIPDIALEDVHLVCYQFVAS